MNKDLRVEFKTKQFQDMLKKALGTTCVNCGSNEHIHYHHIVPLINGGTNNLGNIVPLCEAYQDFDDKKFKGVHEEGRLRRMPDLLPVRM